jgi:hypothetical protein
MINKQVTNALFSLGITEWYLKKEPTNEAEFLEYFKKIVGVDSKGAGIESSDPDNFGVSWKEIEAEIIKTSYKEQRAKAYPSFADQFDLLYHGGYDAWKAAIDAVKQEYPK